ncbi:glyoxalase [Streptomyces sp. BI20]|uniref:glyoxalase n=1 Tax=Streptomyces sp. BI20 TaxID=3403460 RepID=UPI003C70887A
MNTPQPPHHRTAPETPTSESPKPEAPTPESPKPETPARRARRERAEAEAAALRAALPTDARTVPLLPCADPDATLAFYRALGFETTWEQRRPYLYLALTCAGVDLHFGPAPAGTDPSREESGGALIAVEDVAPFHAAFTAGLRAALGRVPTSGLPRVTRLRPGASRFTVVDPNGNSLIVVRRDEPDELEYGGSKELTGLARGLDNARILLEFKNDPAAAHRALAFALRRHGPAASPEDRARAEAMLAEIAVDLPA